MSNYEPLTPCTISKKSNESIQRKVVNGNRTKQTKQINESLKEQTKETNKQTKEQINKQTNKWTDGPA